MNDLQATHRPLDDTGPSFVAGLLRGLAAQVISDITATARTCAKRCAPERFAQRQAAALSTWLAAHSNFLVQAALPSRTVSVDTMIQWDRWPNLHHWLRPRDQGWWLPGVYGLERAAWPHAWRPLCTSEVLDLWCGDILDVDGLSASKSSLDDFADLDAFARHRCPKWIVPETADQLAWCLDHDELRITHIEGARFVFADWDGRLFLLNGGGSHHFAAARHIARALDTTVSVSGRLEILRLNSTAVTDLRADYALYAINPELIDAWRIIAIELDISFGILRPPSPISDFMVLVLDRCIAHSGRVIGPFQERGAVDIVNSHCVADTPLSL